MGEAREMILLVHIQAISVKVAWASREERRPSKSRLLTPLRGLGRRAPNWRNSCAEEAGVTDVDRELPSSSRKLPISVLST